MSETVKVEIPAPPKGWVIDKYRTPKYHEIYFHENQWHLWVLGDAVYGVYPVAVKAEPSRRLMTPAECAGKWIVCPDGKRYMITTIQNDFFWLECGAHLVVEAYDSGYMIADTPGGEPYSLMIEDDSAEAMRKLARLEDEAGQQD